MQGRFQYALARRPGPDAGAGLTDQVHAEVDVERLCRQHEAYLAALRDAGVQVQLLPALPGCPDAYFVEDVALILGDVAIITRPGAPQRRAEVASMVTALQGTKTLHRIEPPGTLDGGDVLLLGTSLFVGVSSRTSPEGVDQLGALVGTDGYTVVPVPVPAGLHLKSSVTALSEDTLLLTGDLVDAPAFEAYRKVLVPDHEREAANTLWVNDRVLLPAGFPETRRRVAAAGFEVLTLDNS